MRKFLQFLKCPQSLITKLTKPTYEDIKAAVWYQQLQKISQLVEQGAPMFHKEKGQSILHFATIENKVEAAEYIAQNYPELNCQKNEDGDTPLMLALFASNHRIIKLLFPLSNLNSRDNNGNTPFMIAAANGNLSALQYLADLCENTEAKNNQGQTALHRAAYHGQLQSIKFLLKKTTLKFSQTDRNNNNSLHMACLGCNVICIKYIICKVKNSQKLIQAQNRQNKTPFDVLQQMINKLNTYKKPEKNLINFQQVFQFILNKD